jgi:hypothetical protein
MSKHFLNKRFILIGIIIFFCILPIPILYHWFSNGTIIYFWDANFPVDPILGLYHYFYLWNERIFPGFFDTGWSWIPYIILLAFFNTVFHSLSLVQAFLYWILLVSSLLTFYFLLRYLISVIGLKGTHWIKSICILGSILYTFNTYVFYYSFRIFNPQEFITSFLPLNFFALLKLFPMERLQEPRTKKNTFVWFLIFFY